MLDIETKGWPFWISCDLGELRSSWENMISTPCYDGLWSTLHDPQTTLERWSYAHAMLHKDKLRSSWWDHQTASAEETKAESSCLRCSPFMRFLLSASHCSALARCCSKVGLSLFVPVVFCRMSQDVVIIGRITRQKTGVNLLLP
jgi:hypothetical protein